MPGFNLDRYVYLPVWRMLRALLILDSLLPPRGGEGGEP